MDKYVKSLSRPSRQFNLVPENDISKQFQLLGESVQGMRDGSFGPLNIGFSDIKIMTDAISHYSRGAAYLEQGKKYIKLVDVMRKSYTTFPGDFLDAFSALRDYAEGVEHTKDQILNSIQQFVSYADNVPWTGNQFY